MKKIFSLFSALLMVGSMMAGVLIDYNGTATLPAGITLSGSTVMANVKINADANGVDCIQLKNGFTTSTKYNGNAIILHTEGGFKAGDTLSVTAFFNNADETKESKVALFTLGEGDAVTTAWFSEQFINGKTNAADPTAQTYVLKKDMDSIMLGRQGNTGTNIWKLSVVRPEPMRVYCKMEYDWWTVDGAAIAIYAYGSDDIKNANWPGERMTLVEGETDIWYIDLANPKAYNAIIFFRVNGGTGTVYNWNAKTGDLLLTDKGENNLYTITSSDYTWADEGNLCTGVWSVYGDEPEPTINYYLAGTMNDWGSIAMPDDSIDLSLEAGEHMFKVKLDPDNWAGALGFDAINAECSSEGLVAGENGNVRFTLAEAGDVKIKVVEGQICVTGAFITSAPLPTYNYYLAGTMTDPAWSSVGMDGDSIVLSLAAGTHQFKVQHQAGNWDTALGYTAVNAECSSEGLVAGENGNVVFTFTETGEVKIKIVEGQICVTGALYVPVRETFTFHAGVAADGNPTFFVMTALSSDIAPVVADEFIKMTKGEGDVYTAEVDNASQLIYVVRCATGAESIAWGGSGNVWNGSDWKSYANEYWFAGYTGENGWFLALSATEPVRETFTFHAGAAADANPTFFVMTRFGESDPVAEVIMMTKGEGDVYTADVFEGLESLYIVRCATDAESVVWDGEGRTVWNGSDWVASVTEYWFVGYSGENGWILDLSTTKPITTDINSIEAGKTAKVIENGQVVIIREGVRYNVVGAKL